MGMGGSAIRHAARKHARSATCTAHNTTQDDTRQEARHIKPQHNTTDERNITQKSMTTTHPASYKYIHVLTVAWCPNGILFCCLFRFVLRLDLCLPPLSCMAPHLTPAEFDFIKQQEALGKSPIELHKALTRRRARQGLATPTLPRFRLALRGLSYRRARKETRGRKMKVSRSAVLKMNLVRKRLIKKAQGQREVRWEDVCKGGRVRKVHRTTLLRAFRREKIPVQARNPRLKPGRTQEQAAARVAYCQKWARKPPSFFVDDLDLIIDNKQFDVPTTQRARQYIAAQRVRFHLRTPAEGVQPEMTKPGRKKNRMNTGAVAKVCAGISNGRIVMWEYLAKRWTGEEAAKLYRGAIIKTIQKVRGVKRKYKVFEDNDPTGYKSKVGKKAKAELGIDAIPMPVFSPDLNPLDYCLWEEISRRMVKGAPGRLETVQEYKKRLRRTALRLPTALVTRAVRAMPSRMRAVVHAKGHSIKAD